MQVLEIKKDVNTMSNSHQKDSFNKAIIVQLINPTTKVVKQVIEVDFHKTASTMYCCIWVNSSFNCRSSAKSDNVMKFQQEGNCFQKAIEPLINCEVKGINTTLEAMAEHINKTDFNNECLVNIVTAHA